MQKCYKALENPNPKRGCYERLKSNDVRIVHMASSMRPFPCVNVQIVVQDLDVEKLFQGRLDLLDARIAKLQDFTGVGEDHVVVLLDPVTLLILRHLVAKLVLADEVAVDE